MHVLCPDGLGGGCIAFHLAWGKAETTKDTQGRDRIGGPFLALGGLHSQM